jgi:hypothetical protein
VTEPDFKTEPAGAPDLMCLEPGKEGTATMAEVALERLRQAKPPAFKDVIELNGGLPKAPAPSITRLDATHVTVESEPGLQLPGLLYEPQGKPVGGVVLFADGGKLQAKEQLRPSELVQKGLAVLVVDPRGVGELGPLELRYFCYLGAAPTFYMGFDVAQAARALQKMTGKVSVVGCGPAASMAAAYAALIEPKIDRVIGLEGFQTMEEAFLSDELLCVTPNADLSTTLEALRAEVGRRGTWGFKGQPRPDLWGPMSQRP